MKKLIILFLIPPLFVFSQQTKENMEKKISEKKHKEGYNYFIGVQVGVVSGLGSFRNWGNSEGSGVGLRMGHHLSPRLSLIGKLGLYQFTVDKTKFELAFRNEYHLSNEFLPYNDSITHPQYLSPFYLLGGLRYIIPINGKFSTEIKIFTGVQVDGYSPYGVLTRQYNGIMEGYNFQRKLEAYFPIDIEATIRYQIIKGLNVSLGSELFYANENVTMNVDHFINNKSVEYLEYKYKANLLVLNINAGFIFIFDKRQW